MKEKMQSYTVKFLTPWIVCLLILPILFIAVMIGLPMMSSGDHLTIFFYIYISLLLLLPIALVLFSLIYIFIRTVRSNNYFLIFNSILVIFLFGGMLYGLYYMGSTF